MQNVSAPPLLLMFSGVNKKRLSKKTALIIYRGEL